MHRQVANDELHSFYHFQTSVSSIIDFRYPQFVLKMTTIGEGLSAIICKMLPQILFITKSTNSRVQRSMFMLLSALFISFPVRHTANFWFDGRDCIGDLMANAMVRKLMYSEFDR